MANDQVRVCKPQYAVARVTSSAIYRLIRNFAPAGKLVGRFAFLAAAWLS